MIGSPDYLSPEQARAEPVSPQTDIYSLGVVLYEMLAGQHPWPGQSSVERLFRHINDPLPGVQTIDENIRDAVNDVIQTATAKNPSQRYDDVLSMSGAFREAAALSVSRVEAGIVELLTPREQDVLKLIIEGKSNREIALALTVELATVKWYAYQIYQKLNVRSRVQAIVKARELNLIVDGYPRDDATTTFSSLPEPDNPFKGLSAFTAADEQDFFGRGRMVRKLIHRMAQEDRLSRFLAVVGPSGSGKSSLVKAGLVPALWRGDLEGSDRWYTIDMLPGSHPLDELEVALTRIAADQKTDLHEQLQRDERGLLRAANLVLPDDDSELLIAIDQFEEVFTLVEDEERRQHFLDLIYIAVTEPRSRVRVVISLRADFYDRPLQYPQFGELVRDRMETVLPLGAEELEQAIVKPAERVGVSYEEGLVPLIIEDVHYQAGALPLLQYALTELFEQRDGRMLTHEGYQQIGRAVGALAARAEQTYHEFDETGQEAIRQMFLRLVTLGEGVEDTRRRIYRRELLDIAADPDLMDEVIDTYAAYRLLALDYDPATRRPTVEVAHEALLREWERLREWLNDSRADIRLQRQLARAARDWEEADQEPGFLIPGGARLEQFEEWALDTELALTPIEVDFLETSLQAEAERQTREVQQQRSRRNLQRGFIGALIVGLVVAIGLSIFAFGQQRAAELSALESQSIALAVSAEKIFNSGDHRLGLTLAHRAARMVDDPPAEVYRILVELSNAPGPRAVIEHGSEVWALDTSPDGRILAAAGGSADNPEDDFNIYFYDIDTGERLTAFEGHESRVFTIAFSPDGQTMASGDRNDLIIMWDVATGQEIRRFEGHEGFVFSVEYSPDGQQLLSTSEDHMIFLWDIDTGDIVQRFEGHTESVMGALFMPDSDEIISIAHDDTIRIWNIDTGEFRSVYIPDFLDTRLFDGFSINSDGTVGFFADAYGQPIKIDLTTLEVIDHFGVVTDEAIHSVDLSPDERWLATGDSSSTVTIRDTTSGEALFRLDEHSDFVRRVRFTPDGQRLVSASRDGTISIFDLVPANESRQFRSGNADGFWGLAVSPDGKILAAGKGASDFDFIAGNDIGYQVVLWDIETGEEIRRLESFMLSIWELRFSPDGERIVAISRDGIGFGDTVAPRVKMWDVSTGELIREYAPGGAPFYVDIDFSPDGRSLLITGDEIVHLLDVETGETLRRFVGHSDWGASVDFSTNGQQIVTGSWDESLIVWDVAASGQVTRFTEHNSITAGLFLPDGQSIISTAWDDPHVRIWDIESGETLRQYDSSATSTILAVSPDGQFAAFAGQDNGIIVVSLKTGAQLAQFLGHTALIYNIEFHPDGQRLYSISWDGTVREWLLPPDDIHDVLQWVEDNRAIRDLSIDEQARYGLGDLPEGYRSDFSFGDGPTPAVPTSTPLEAVSIELLPATIGDNRGEVAGGEVGNGGWNTWRYQGQAGEILTFKVTADALYVFDFDLPPEQPGLDAEIKLYGPDGLLLIENRDASNDLPDPMIEAFELPVDGQYTIEIQGEIYGGFQTSGAYTLTIEPYVPPTAESAHLFKLYSDEPLFRSDRPWDGPSSLIFHDGQYYMFSQEIDTETWPSPVVIKHYTSDNPLEGWTPESEELLPTAIFPEDYPDDVLVPTTALVTDDGTWRLYFYSWNRKFIGLATADSPNGPWTVHPTPILERVEDEDPLPPLAVVAPSVLQTDEGFVMYYSAQISGQGVIKRATSTDGINNWVKDPEPVLSPAQSGWDSGREVSLSSVIITENGQWVMSYSGLDQEGKLKIGIATSQDGITWERFSDNPVFAPEDVTRGRYIWYVDLFYEEGIFYLFMNMEVNNAFTARPFVATFEGEF